MCEQGANAGTKRLTTVSCVDGSVFSAGRGVFVLDQQTRYVYTDEGVFIRLRDSSERRK